ncbi:MAG: hypothetical protein SFX18_08185 [Pirellulales bacterium]|nr:hypothetical protein [Pirellulales bacterium]
MRFPSFFQRYSLRTMLLLFIGVAAILNFYYLPPINRHNAIHWLEKSKYVKRCYASMDSARNQALLLDFFYDKLYTDIVSINIEVPENISDADLLQIYHKISGIGEIGSLSILCDTSSQLASNKTSSRDLLLKGITFKVNELSIKSFRINMDDYSPNLHGTSKLDIRDCQLVFGKGNKITLPVGAYIQSSIVTNQPKLTIYGREKLYLLLGGCSNNCLIKVTGTYNHLAVNLDEAYHKANIQIQGRAGEVDVTSFRGTVLPNEMCVDISRLQCQILYIRDINKVICSGKLKSRLENDGVGLFFDKVPRIEYVAQEE